MAEALDAGPRTGTLDESPIITLLEALERLRPGRSRSDLRKLLADERVTVNGQVVVIAKMPIAPDDVVRVATPNRPPAKTQWPFKIVHADNDVLVIDKPAGLLTSTVPREKRPTALAIVRQWAAVERPQARVGLVHRLDADASGLLCFSLNNAAHASLKKQFADHTAGRTYAAVVASPVKPSAGTIKSLLAEYADGTVHVTRDGRHGKTGITHYETAVVNGGHTLLHVRLETGRKHQIRVHLSEKDRPIVGDRVYDGEHADRLMLAAIRLEIDHPGTGERATYEIELPGSLKKMIEGSAE